MSSRVIVSRFATHLTLVGVFLIGNVRVRAELWRARGDGAAAQQPYCEDWFSAAIL